jgi:peptide-methionine (S)-S-oxide reductase
MHQRLLRSEDNEQVLCSGVSKVVSGYAGGHKENPTYKEVCTGTTNHAEVVQVNLNEIMNIPSFICPNSSTLDHIRSCNHLLQAIIECFFSYSWSYDKRSVSSSSRSVFRPEEKCLFLPFRSQGVDVGTQYRSVIFYHDAVQQKEAEMFKAHLTDENAFTDPIVTEILPIDQHHFFTAEEYHQNYFNLNPNQGYCSAVVKSKVDKFMNKFHDLLKTQQ